MSIHIQSFDSLFRLFGAETLHNGKDMLFYPSIKKRKHKKLSKKYKLDKDETIFFARNLNIRQKFKKGLLLTDKGLRARFSDDRPMVVILWESVLNISYSHEDKAIDISYIERCTTQSIAVPMKFFVKKKKYYEVGAEYVFMPLMETLAYVTRSKNSNIPENNILDNIVAIPRDVPIKRMNATKWWFVILTAIATVASVILLSQSKSTPKDRKPSANLLNGMSVLGTTGSALISGMQASAQGKAPASCPPMMKMPQYRQLPDGQCEVTDVLGYKHVYLNFDMASHLSDFFTGFPVSLRQSPTTSSSSSPSSKLSPQAQYEREKLDRINSLTSQRDEAVRNYRNARSSNDRAAMERWSRMAHDAQGAINVALPQSTYSLGNDVKGIDF